MQAKTEQHVGFRTVKAVPARGSGGRPAGSKYDAAIRAVVKAKRVEVENPGGIRPRVLYSILHSRIRQLGLSVRVSVRGERVFLEAKGTK